MVFYLKTDYDNSYIESKSIRKKISWGENTISIDFSKYSDIDSIRFDPFLDRCVIKLNSIKLSSSKKDDSLILEISNISSNAIFSVGSYYLFNNDDPQFEIKLKRSNYNILSIDFYVYKIYETDAINDLLFLLKDKNNLLDINKKYEEEMNSLLDMNKKYEEENAILLKIKKEKEYFEKSYHIILNSNSWKITKPIRLILDKIKESSSVNLIKKFLNHIKKYGFMFTFYKVKDYLRRDKACIIKDNNNLMEVITFNGMINYIDNYSKEKESLIYGKEQILEYDNYNINKNIILVSHALDLTGALSAVVFFAEKLKRDGYNVIVVSPISGRLIELLYEKGIPVIVYKDLFSDNFIQRYCSLFSLVIANTIVSSPIISQLSMSKIRVLWWIHEADTSYHEGQIKSIPQNIGSNVKIYCGGSYAANVFKKYFPQHSTEILLYYISEISNLFNSENYKLNYYNTRKRLFLLP